MNSITPVSCVYLLKLSKLPNVYKYGFTKDFKRRYKEHTVTFNKYNINIESYKYVNIDKEFMSKAEKDISDYISQLNLNYDFHNFKELFQYHGNIKLIEKVYIDTEYKYNFKKMDTDRKILELSYQNELLKKDLIIEQLKNNKYE